MKWKPGRQEGTHLFTNEPLTYHKLIIYEFMLWSWGFDCYILRYPANFSLPMHKDPVKGEHWRLNITLKGFCVFIIQKTQLIYSGRRIHFFRPDTYRHGLYTRAKTYKLSFGFAKHV